MILTFYGKGKGKSSCALGIVLRSTGHKKKVLFCQFIKKDWETGEDLILKTIKNVNHKKFGLGFILPKDDFKKHRQAVKEGINYIKDNANCYDLVVLDEILVAISLKLISSEEVISIIRYNPKPDYILTGRPKIKKINDISDLISRIDKIKHPFDVGIKAKKGIDW